MTLSTDIRDNESKKLRDGGVNGTRVAVSLEESTGDINGLLSGVKYNDIQATYPTGSTELYTYLFDSTIVAQIEITYTNSSKTNFLRARRV